MPNTVLGLNMVVLNSNCMYVIILNEFSRPTWNIKSSFQVGLRLFRETALLLCFAQSTGIPHNWTSTCGHAWKLLGQTYCPEIS